MVFYSLENSNVDTINLLAELEKAIKKTWRRREISRENSMPSSFLDDTKACLGLEGDEKLATLYQPFRSSRNHSDTGTAMDTVLLLLIHKFEKHIREEEHFVFSWLSLSLLRWAFWRWVKIRARPNMGLIIFNLPTFQVFSTASSFLDDSAIEFRWLNNR